MSRDFEYEIRDAVADLADEGRSVSLADAAIREGRHIVRRRRAVTAAATFVVLAILVVPFTLNRPARQFVQQPGAAPAPSASGPAPSTSRPAPTGAAAAPNPTSTLDVVDPVPGLVPLPDGMIFGSIPRAGGDSLVYNRSTGQYVRVPYQRVVPAPYGSTAAIDDGRRLGLIDLESGALRWATGPAPIGTTFDWSPDGTQLTYLTKSGKPGAVRVAVLIVAKSLAVTVGSDIICPMTCVSAWLPDGQAIAVSGADGKLPIRLVDPSTGSPRKGLERVTGVLASGHGVSDDGTLVVTQIGPEAGVSVIATGQVILTLAADPAQTYWSSGHELVVVSSVGVVVYALTGESIATYPLPPTLATGAALPTLPTLMRG